MRNLTWGLLVATHNRPDALETCVALALGQTRPPVEVIVADSSPDWEITRDRIGAALGNRPEIRHIYERARRPSLTVQRNQAIAASRADILFLIDDDSFMHPSCAEEILAIYEADPAAEVAGVQAELSDIMPTGATDLGARKRTGHRDLSQGVRGRLVNWIWRRVLLMNMEENFIPYEGRYPDHPLPAGVRQRPVHPTRLFHGCRMTFRREAVARESFDGLLSYYCPGEDVDASYRVSRHGCLVTAPDALLHHYTAASGRIDRVKTTLLSCLNQAVLLRRHATDLAPARRAYFALLRRRLLAEALKDVLSRRFGLPQLRGTLQARRLARQVFAMSPEELERWYPGFQERLIKG